MALLDYPQELKKQIISRIMHYKVLTSMWLSQLQNRGPLWETSFLLWQHTSVHYSLVALTTTTLGTDYVATVKGKFSSMAATEITTMRLK